MIIIPVIVEWRGILYDRDMTNKTQSTMGLHVATESRNGYGEVAPYARGVLSFEHGAIDPANGEIGEFTTTIYRDVNAWALDPTDPDSHCDADKPPNLEKMTEEQARANARVQWSRWKAINLAAPADAYQILNEVGGSWNPGDGDEVLERVTNEAKAAIAFEDEIMMLNEEDGHPFTLLVGSMAGDNPHWLSNIWQELWTPHIWKAWEMGHWYGRHAYTGVNSSVDVMINEQGEPADENVKRPFIEIDWFLENYGACGPIVLSECGYVTYPGEPKYTTQMVKYDNYIRESGYDKWIGFQCLFTYGEWWNANIEDSSPELHAWMSNNVPTKWEPTFDPGITTPPTDPPTEPPTEITELFRIDFTGYGVADEQEPVGWYDSEQCPNIQVPMAIHADARLPMTYEKFSGDNPFNPDGQSWNDFTCPEGVVMWDALLPPNEHYFLNEEGRTYHWFCPQTAGRSRYSRDEYLKAGTYKLTLELIGDFSVKVDGQKEPQPDPKHGGVELFVGTQGKDDWIDIALLGKNIIVREFEITQDGDYPIGYGLLSRFAAGEDGTAGMFLQGFSVEMASEEVDPPVEPPITGTTEEKIFQISQSWAFPVNEDAALQKAGLDDGYTPSGVERWLEVDGSLWAMQPFFKMDETDRKRSYFCLVNAWDNVEWTDGTTQPGVFGFTHWPTQHRVVTQEFLANPDDYNKFNLPGHDGVDVRAYHGDPVYSVADGVVCDIIPASANHNYGIAIRVQHVDDYQTTYAHLKQTVRSVGEAVAGGDIIGLADNTGNSFGDHLHLTLKKIGYPFTDRCGNAWPSNICDPTPFMVHFDGVAWPGGSPGFPCPGEPTEPEPPTGEQYDLYKYLAGDGRIYIVKNSSGSSERFQTQFGQGSWWYQTKNSNAESMYIDGGYIGRDWDTSPGGGRYYRQQQDGVNGAHWMPQYMRVGESFTVSLHVQFYNSDNCTESEANSGNVTDKRTFVEHLDSWTSQYGITVQDVIVLRWDNGGEYYYYARGFGLVAWGREHDDPNTPMSSAISEITEGQEPNKMDVPNCLIW